ncbi:hypothetical protein EYZ11_004385 [Aspergillus tanneri]|uniref:Atos-like C-terminal domain-containing protein n=1 Tax=Aspergillus tanneri TaxID=1220188 RepID=A0A4V3UPX6_9EURO|nr:hypothetical protein EYZ11_004385 [Aspergillus tanneri]
MSQFPFQQSSTAIQLPVVAGQYRMTIQAPTRRRRRHQSPARPYGDQSVGNSLSSRSNDQDTLRRREKRHRRAESPKCPPGGCYRIPQQGQLQIIIKNPNKTAVKLFLVPYDLSDMEPGTKTFIRQRSYSAGPVIDMPLSARKNYGTDRPEASLITSEDLKDKPILSIRVVFANRVPDGKEQLRNEIQHPDPRYTPYKPARDVSHSQMATRSAMERELQPPTANHEPISGLYPDHHAVDIRDKLLILPLHESDPVPREHAEGGTYHKLSKGDIGYGGYRSAAGFEAGESLLAKRLRGLEVQKNDSPDIN